MAFWFDLHLSHSLQVLVFLFCLSFGIVDSDDRATLLEIKKSFRDVENVLYDWTDSPSSDYCVWRGLLCDNVTFNVIALNLSGLNLDGEISPSMGDLKSLLSVYGVADQIDEKNVYSISPRLKAFFDWLLQVMISTFSYEDRREVQGI